MIQLISKFAFKTLVITLVLGNVPAFACIGTTYKLEAWQPSVSGSGFDLIVNASGKQYYVPEEQGILMTLILAKSNEANWSKAIRTELDAKRIVNPTDICTSPAGDKVMVEVENSVLLKSALKSVVAGLAPLRTRPSTNSLDSFIAQTQSSKYDRFLNIAEKIVNSSGAKLSATDWCTLLKTLQDGLPATLTYGELKPGTEFKSLDPSEPKSKFALHVPASGSFTPWDLTNSIKLGEFAPKTRGGCSAGLSGTLPAQGFAKAKLNDGAEELSPIKKD